MTSLTGRRIAITSRIFAPEPGAASLRLAALVTALAESGAEVTVLTSTVPAAVDNPPLTFPESVRVRRAPVLRDKAGYVRGYVQYLSFDIPLFFRILCGRRFDVIVAEPPPTSGLAVWLACTLRRTPYVYYAADVWSEAAAVAGAPRFVTRAVARLESFVASGASAVAAVSASVKSRMEHLAPSARVVDVGNGYDADVFTPTGAAHHERRPYLLYAGTASEVHGAMIFIDALPAVVAAVPDALVAFIGQGSEWQAMQERAELIAPGSTLFLPRMSPEDTATWIRGARGTLASVLPDGYDAFPTKMLASVGCGTPVVYAGPDPGRAFASDPHVGRAVSFDAADVADAMIATLQSAQTEAGRERLAGWARAQHSLESVMMRMRQLIASTLNRAG